MKDKNHILRILLPALLLLAGCAARQDGNGPYVSLFTYTTADDQGKSGMHYAWSDNDTTWHVIGAPYAFFSSDYGNWSTEKHMNAPCVIRDAEGTWHCVWSLNDRENTFAHAASPDLIYWGRQTYPFIDTPECLAPVLTYDARKKQFAVTYKTKDGGFHRIVTADFKTFQPAVTVTESAYSDPSVTRQIDGKTYRGQLHRIPQAMLDTILAWQQEQDARAALYRESLREDGRRFRNLSPFQAALDIHPEDNKAISDMLIGVFFEDISYGADGGLYAELVQNRDFEYQPSDKLGRDRTWNSFHSWQLQGEGGTFAVDTAGPVHPNNPHYAVLTVAQPGVRLCNTGYDGIPLRKGERYDYAFFVKTDRPQRVRISLTDAGRVLASAVCETAGNGWQHLEGTLTAPADAASAVIALEPLAAGTYCFDLVSLFPQNTFNGRKNGLRRDLAQAIADLHPRFVRFPGGCVAHGDGLENMYRWKNTIGPLEARKGQRNIWNYRQSYGLGYYEFFLFCEDIGAEPLPVLPAGVPCQNSQVGGGGQQGGIPMDQMDDYVQEVLDLIEYANGDATTHWGAQRAAAGHPEPFHLKYIGIGNEDLITDVFEERFTMIFKAVREKYPDITLIGTVGPFYQGTDYTEGWELARRLQVPMVDEHYYVSPGWYIHNQDFYDRYDREGPKVYLGEYASHASGKPNNMESALTEALHLVNVERNGDVVAMTSYAPLLARERHTNWTPDLIFFDNAGVRLTTDYEVQRLFGNNAGNRYIRNEIKAEGLSEDARRRLASSVVRDDRTGDLIVKTVNLLPVEVTLRIDPAQTGTAAARAEVTVLAGNPSDRQVVPETSVLPVDRLPDLRLAPYSLTVVRIPAK